jgi:hypothetical protein
MFLINKSSDFVVTSSKVKAKFQHQDLFGRKTNISLARVQVKATDHSLDSTQQPSSSAEPHLPDGRKATLELAPQHLWVLRLEKALL